MKTRDIIIVIILTMFTAGCIISVVNLAMRQHIEVTSK